MHLLYVVGIGPGDKANRTFAAQQALMDAEVLVGYGTYIDLLKEEFFDKQMIAAGMTREQERCKAALEQAASGRTVAVVCSGDAGVYGMAGLVYELAPAYPSVEIRVIPGVTAALAGAAVLGAPLTHDFALISLSDRLTSWEVIEKRLTAAAQADFCIALYNPASHARWDYLARACDILLGQLPPQTLCGYVCNIGRKGEYQKILPLSLLREIKADMFTTVFIGNSATKRIGDSLITPRGYRLV